MTLILRSVKGHRLTHDEMDGNWQHAVDSANSTFVQSGSGASSRTVQAKLREVQVSITDYGATDSADISTAFNSIKTAYPNGCTIVIPETENYWLLSSAISTPDDTPYIIQGRGAKSLIKKGFNGDMITLGKQSQMWHVHIDGDGGTYTGRGVLISSGGNDVVSWRNLFDCHIDNMEDHCVDFTASSAGMMSQIIGGIYRTTAQTTAAFGFSADVTIGHRHIIGVNTASTPIADLTGAIATFISGCAGGAPVFSSTTTTAVIIGNRLNGTSITIDGTNNNISHNVIAATSVTFNSDMASCRVLSNHYGSGATFTDNADGTNEIEYASSYTPAWTSTGTAPSLENGTLNGVYWREGRMVRLKISFVAGSSTTFGTGTWSFSIPKTAFAGISVGSALLTDTTTAFYGATSHIGSGASTVQVFGYNVGASIGASNPFTWASTDRLSIDIVYPIAT